MYNVNAIDIIHYLVSICLTLGTQLSFSPPRNSLFLFVCVHDDEQFIVFYFVHHPTLHPTLSRVDPEMKKVRQERKGNKTRVARLPELQ